MRKQKITATYESQYKESIELPPATGASWAALPEADDLTERGLVGDENYDRDSYDFGKPAVSARADRPVVAPACDDPLMGETESEFTIITASGRPYENESRLDDWNSIKEADKKRKTIVKQRS